MARAGLNLEALAETVVFLDYFNDLRDPRQAGKVRYPLPEVLLLCLLAVLAGAETFVDIARFGEKKIELLRRFRPFSHGTPALTGRFWRARSARSTPTGRGIRPCRRGWWRG